MDASQQNFTISKMFTNTVDNLIMRLTLAGSSIHTTGGATRHKPPATNLAPLVRS
jgi:hypothetical protein